MREKFEPPYQETQDTLTGENAFLRREQRMARLQERQSLKRKIAGLALVAISMLGMEKGSYAYEEGIKVVALENQNVKREKAFTYYKLNWEDGTVQKSWEEKFRLLGLLTRGGEFRKSPFGGDESYLEYVNNSGAPLYEVVRVKGALQEINGAKITDVTAIRDLQGNLLALFVSGKKSFIPFSQRFVSPHELDPESQAKLIDYFSEIKQRAQSEPREKSVQD